MQMFGLKSIKQIWVIFTHLEVVGCRSVTQLQVGENLNYITLQVGDFLLSD